MSRLGVTTKVDNQKQVVNVNPVNNINVSVRSPSDIQQEVIGTTRILTIQYGLDFVYFLYILVYYPLVLDDIN